MVKKLAVLLILCLMASVVCISSWQGGVYADNTWSTKADMSTTRSNVAVVSLSGKVYAIGGINSTGSLSTIEEYDPTMDTWIMKANMPTAREGACAVALNSKIYVIGGKQGSTYMNKVEEYNPSTNTWVGKVAMPTTCFGATATTVNGKIYVMGGYDGMNFLNTVHEYDPSTDTWTAKANIPTARSSFGAVVANSKIYAVGGYNGSYLNTVEEYNPSTNIWTTKTNMITARRGLGVAVVNNQVYASGGYNGAELNTMEEYNPVTNTWVTKVGMPTPRGWLGVAAVGNNIYHVGGTAAGSYLKIVEVADVNKAPSTPVITRTPSGNNVPPNTPVTITATSTDPEGDAITYVWEGRPAETSVYPLGKNTIRVKAVDALGAESSWATIQFYVANTTNSGGMLLTGAESLMVENGIEGATITQYTFTVPPVSGHGGSDYGRVRGYNVTTGVWDQLSYQTTSNGITFTRTLTPGVYSKLEFYYYTNHGCMFNKSYITYSVTYSF